MQLDQSFPVLDSRKVQMMEIHLSPANYNDHKHAFDAAWASILT